MALAEERLGSEPLAKERLPNWLAAEKLPWDCTEWKGLDTEGVARLKPKIRAAKFWSARLEIDWPNNTAREIIETDSEYGRGWHYGAETLGIKVSRTHLLALLPEAPNEHEKTGDPLPAKAKKTAQGWQVRRVLQALPKAYPPDGKVSDDVPTEDVRGRVAEVLSPDSKNRELASPSWDTANRALGRD